MFAIIKTGGKQYRVVPDAVLEIEKLEGAPGTRITFPDVLMVGGDGETRIGAPRVEGARVEAEILTQGRGDKVTIIKKKRRKGYHRKKGHRQHLTSIKITEIRAA